MALQLSTGLRNKLLDTNPFRLIFNLGFLSLYAGALPATADAVLAGGNTLLCRISNNNTTTGLTFAANAAAGVITKTLAETWSKAAVAGGTTTFFRLEAAGDDGLASTVEARVQGTCGLSGADLNLAVVLLVNSTVYTIDNWSISLPTL